MENVRV